MSDYVRKGSKLIRRSRAAALIIVVLVLLGVGLVASVPPSPDRGGVVPFLGMATGAVITLIRAWELAMSKGERRVLTARRWRLILFVLIVIAFGCYAVWAGTLYKNAFGPGLSLMATALLIGTLLFEPNPSTKKGSHVPLHDARE